MLGLCLEPRGSLLLPPPALPEPGLCAACPPCPFVPQGRRRWKAHRARGLAPALTLTPPAPCPCPQGRTSAHCPVSSLEPWRADPHPLLLLWGMWVQPWAGGISAITPSHPGSYPPCPLAQLLPAEKQIFGPYLRSHVLCVVSSLSHLCPALQLVFKFLGCPPLPGSPLVSCQAFCKEKPLGER